MKLPDAGYAPDHAGYAPERFRFDTRELPAATRFEQYRTLFSAGGDAFQDGDDFLAIVSSTRFTRMTLYDRRLRHVGHVRDAARVARDGFDHLTVTACLSGKVFAAAEDDWKRIHPGEIMILDTSRPTANRIVDGHILTVGLARDAIRSVIANPSELSGTVIPVARAAPVVRYMRELAEHRGDADPATTVRAGTTLASALATIVAPDQRRDRRAQVRAARLLAARQFIDAHLADRRLSLATLADGIAISQSTVCRLLEPLGGLGQYIQERRLERLRQLLTERSSSISMPDLVEDAGFASESHASRAFLKCYGERPGSFRNKIATLNPMDEAVLRMRLWLKEVR